MKTYLLSALFLLRTVSLFAQTPLPYTQDFEPLVFPPTGWQTFPIGSSVNWEHKTGVSGHGVGDACAHFDNFNTPAGGYYGIRLPYMDFTGVTKPYVRFEIAYAQRTGANSDVFGFWWSDNGSSNWKNIKNYSGANLTTAAATASMFTPSATEWKTVVLSLVSLAGKPYVRLAIEDDCANGNLIFFDNVTVFDSSLSGIEDYSPVQHVDVYPTIFSSTIHVDGQQLTFAQLYNVAGQPVSVFTKTPEGLINDNLYGLPAGVYIVLVNTPTGMLHRKVVKL